MTILLLVLAALCFWRLRIPGFHQDFLSSANVLPVKGVFTFLVLFSHTRGYLTLTDSWENNLYCAVQDRLGQLIVAMFLFYSGYGIWESYKYKPNYANTLFRRRFLKTLVHFDLVVALFVLVQLLIPIVYPANHYLLCWIGWESVGNSNWFIFDILALYIIAALALLFQSKSKYDYGGIVITFLLTTLLWIFLHKVGKDSWWIDTLAAFPLGMLFSRFKDPMFRLLSKKGGAYLLTILCLLAFSVSYKVLGVDVYGCTTCCFCGLVVMLSSWIRIGNPILNWAGRNAFTIYILQRLPMIVFTTMGINAKPWLFITLSFIATFVLAEFFSRIFTKLDRKIFDAGIVKA